MLSNVDFVVSRFNPFTETYSPNTISDEVHTVPAASEFWVRLAEDVKQDDPSSIEIWTGPGKTGTQLTEVSGTPGNNEFCVDYGYHTGLVLFNSAQANLTVYVSYKGIGTVVKAEDINKFLESTDVDNTSMEVNGSNQLQIKVGGVGYTHMAANSVGANALRAGETAESHLASGAVSQLKLKYNVLQVAYQQNGGGTTTVECTISSFGFSLESKCELAGGTPSTASNCEIEHGPADAVNHTTWSPRIFLTVTNADAGGGYVWGGVRQNYVQASGKDQYIYALLDKTTKNIILLYFSADHPCVHTNQSLADCPHPFLGSKKVYDENKKLIYEGSIYNPDEHEIVLIDNSILEEINQLREESKTVQEFTAGVDITDTEGKVKYKAGKKISRTIIQETRSVLEIIMNDYEVDFDSVPEFTEREAKTIDKWGTLPGEIVDIIETRQIANIPIERGFVELKRQVLKAVPAGMQYKKLKRKK